MLEFKLDIRCTECDAPLTAELIPAAASCEYDSLEEADLIEVLQPYIAVTPCRNCLNREYNRGVGAAQHMARGV